jgi:hypothetical protein
MLIRTGAGSGCFSAQNVGGQGDAPAADVHPGAGDEPSGNLFRPAAERARPTGYDGPFPPAAAAGEFCRQHGLAYCETTLLRSYAQALRHLHEVGRPLRASQTS